MMKVSPLILQPLNKSIIIIILNSKTNVVIAFEKLFSTKLGIIHIIKKLIKINNNDIFICNFPIYKK